MEGGKRKRESDSCDRSENSDQDTEKIPRPRSKIRVIHCFILSFFLFFLDVINKLSNTNFFVQKNCESDGPCASASSSVSGGDDDKEGDKDSKKKKNRCATCRKKVGLTGKSPFLIVFYGIATERTISIDYTIKAKSDWEFQTMVCTELLT